MSAPHYFPRHLSLEDTENAPVHVDEAGLLAIAGPKVVLGEPGMGKTELVTELGRRLGIEPLSAVRLMLSKEPAKFVQPGQPLLIDALDEAMSRREGDAVDTILAQLEAVGSPEFILSCRAREWQTRSESNLRRLYGRNPSIFRLEPLSRAEARLFLTQRHAAADADHVLSHLDDSSLADLYGNPLTLELMGRVAERDTHLPSTRAGLFERVCTQIWPEHDAERQDTGLAQITEDQALCAAGAISAGLLFAGAEAVSAAGAAYVQKEDVRLPELASLPGAGAARAVYSSKLFHSVGPARAKPVHRVVAEFLAARWLASQAASPRAQRRLLAQFVGGGAVPASLRGMHAWLAFHSSAMAERVIAADPFGLLRYGETASLTVQQADCLFDALCELAKNDPYFRAADWDAKTVSGLMIPALRDRIDAVIGSAASNAHLRSLLIEGLDGLPLAGDLASTLEEVLLSRERFYREREGAAEALFPLRDLAWWQKAIARLDDLGDEDSTRLARNLIEEIDAKVSDELLVATLFAGMGVTVCPLPRVRKRRPYAVLYEQILGAIPADRLRPVLDLVSSYAGLVAPSDWESARDVERISSHLIVRAIDERVVGRADGATVWRWLGSLARSGRFNRESKEELFSRLSDHVELRHAVQHHALYEARRRDTLWAAEIDLEDRLVGLAMRAGDAEWFLERIADADNQDPNLREDWCDLMRLARGPEGFKPEVSVLADRFMRGDRELQEFRRNLENPRKTPWQIKHERQRAQRECKERVRIAMQRKDYADNRTKLCAGELGAILDPAKAYLGYFSDISRDQPPPERIAEWLGPDLRDDALTGFEHVLHRADIPTAEQIAQGFAEGVTYNFSFPIVAGLLERQRTGKGIADLPPEVRLVGLLLCYNDGWDADDNLPALREALEAMVIATPEERQTLTRLWIEPSLAAGKEHVAGLYKLAHDPDWLATGGALAGEWLLTFPQVPKNVELELVDCLTHSGELATLRIVAVARDAMVFRNFNHMLAWLAIDVLVRFEEVQPDLADIGACNPEFIWFLRNRLLFERRGGMMPLSIAQAEWVVTQFRGRWPYATLEGSGSGDTNPYDATDFLRALLNRIANDTSAEASEALQRLIGKSEDTYTGLIRHLAAEQRQKRAEEAFSPLSPVALGALLTDGPPSNADDLKSLVLDELAVAQKKLIGEDIDQVRDFWTDMGIPRDENRCRDRLAAMIGPDLARYDVQRITEADMPMGKRADLAYARGPLQLPMEVKGQWHEDVWDAATGQLDIRYLIDWRSEQRGIYCVLWFGEQASKTGRRLKAHPDGAAAPTTPEQMQAMLVERIPAARRSLIDVVVLDLRAGARSA